PSSPTPSGPPLLSYPPVFRSNTALTMGAVLARLRRGADEHAGTTLTRAADAALDGARGNSGAILAQFLLGMGDSAASHAALSTEGRKSTRLNSSHVKISYDVF